MDLTLLHYLYFIDFWFIWNFDVIVVIRNSVEMRYLFWYLLALWSTLGSMSVLEVLALYKWSWGELRRLIKDWNVSWSQMLL